MLVSVRDGSWDRDHGILCNIVWSFAIEALVLAGVFICFSSKIIGLVCEFLWVARTVMQVPLIWDGHFGIIDS